MSMNLHLNESNSVFELCSFSAAFARPATPEVTVWDMGVRSAAADLRIGPGSGDLDVEVVTGVGANAGLFAV